MKIAVACEGTQITQHFGHCENFTFFETEGNNIVGSEVKANPGHRPGFLPRFVAENGAEVIIAGGMGGGAVDIFNQVGVEVVVGARGNAEDNVKAYLAGELKSTGSICHEHEHADECH